MNNMTPQNFIYWLKGYSEICEDRPTEKQWISIQEHLDRVFIKVTNNKSPYDASVIRNGTGSKPNLGII